MAVVDRVLGPGSRVTARRARMWAADSAMVDSARTREETVPLQHRLHLAVR